MTSEEWNSPFEDQDLDPAIIIYRAINPRYVHSTNPQTPDSLEMGSQCFQHMSEERALERNYPASAMSVVLSHLLDAYGEAPERVLDEFGEDWGIAAFTVADLRDVKPDLGVCEDPVERAPWHGLVFSKTRRKMNRAQSQAIRAAARLIRPPVNR